MVNAEMVMKASSTLSAVSLLHSTQNILSMYVGFLCGALFPLSPFIKISPFITVPCSCYAEEYFFISSRTLSLCFLKGSLGGGGGVVAAFKNIYLFIWLC